MAATEGRDAMPISIDMAPLLALPKEERTAIAEVLLESVDMEVDFTESPALLAELQRRAADAIANPDDAIPWEQVRDEARARHGR
jgi:putative addiction module component (TIGR02574 family)